jgi:hypothetical protein
MKRLNPFRTKTAAEKAEALVAECVKNVNARKNPTSLVLKVYWVAAVSTELLFRAFA